MLFGKRGDSKILDSTIIFIILNLAFFAGMFAFVVKSGSGAGFYEQVYSREIAVVIDNSEPGTFISVDLSELKKIIDKSGMSYEETIKIENGVVSVKLDKTGYGKKFEFFSNYDVKPSFEVSDDKLMLNLEIS